MDIQTLLSDARSIWGDSRHSLQEIVVRLGVGFGDICRSARGATKDTQDETELKKELGNVIFSTIRWCDDLGYDPVECITLAKEAQRTFAERNPDR